MEALMTAKPRTRASLKAPEVTFLTVIVADPAAALAPKIYAPVVPVAT
jgi:hypothetical protein